MLVIFDCVCHWWQDANTNSARRDGEQVLDAQEFVAFYHSLIDMPAVETLFNKWDSKPVTFLNMSKRLQAKLYRWLYNNVLKHHVFILCLMRHHWWITSCQVYTLFHCTAHVFWQVRRQQDRHDEHRAVAWAVPPGARRRPVRGRGHGAAQEVRDEQRKKQKSSHSWW